MVVKINGKPLKVKEENETKVDWFYLAVTVIGYGLIFWIMRVAYVTFIGAWM